MTSLARAMEAEAAAPAPDTPAIDPSRYVRAAPDGARSLSFMVGGIHCAGCVRAIERALTGLPGLDEARVNFTTYRLALKWRDAAFDPALAMERVSALGYRLSPYDPEALGQVRDREDRRLLVAMAVAGFAAANVMLLSVAVWAGLFAGDMGPATRDLFHWISALIALPAIAFAGRPFFESAAGALKGRRLNMDVPISLAVILAAGMSLYETASGGAYAYFDAAVTLLFFLLIGRYLDRRARSRARFQAEHLLALSATGAMVVGADGALRALPIDEVGAGVRVRVRPGERVPVDGVVRSGHSDIDTSLVSGESTPEAVGPGARLHAGTLNLTGLLELEATAVGEATLLSEIVRLMEAAAQARGRYVRLADRAARIYAPAVHGLGLATFLGWWLLGGLAWQPALMTGIAVLIITCPCALGLAVPAVQIVATGRLLKAGVIVKAADALERLAEADTIVFDKTGTLTAGTPIPLLGEHSDQSLQGEPSDHSERADLETAAALAAGSRHPLARALHAAHPDARPVEALREEPGRGLEAVIDGETVRLGSRAWCGVDDRVVDSVDEGATDDESDGDGPELWLRRGAGAAVRFAFRDRPRRDAATTIEALKRAGYRLVLLSGDRPGAAHRTAAELGIAEVRALASPADKVRLIEDLRAAGHNVLMVGDGLNDAPALAAANASISPTQAADISQQAADALFQGDLLRPVAVLLTTARRARRVALQNFGLALGYNLIAVPLAVAGLVTPLLAAAAMSASSLLVVGNALRLGRGPGPGATARANEGAA